MTAELVTDLSDGVFNIRLNRPEEKNALNDSLCNALLEATEHAAMNPAVRVVVLAAAGSVFCAGGDVKAMASRKGSAPANPFQRAREMKNFMRAAKVLHEMPKPSVALIQGAAAGAGLSLALACDFRICVPDAKLTTAFAKVGLSGDYGGSYFIQRVVGPAKARELYLLCPVLTGQEAYQMGMVTRVFSRDEFEVESSAFVRTLADGPTTAYGFIKDNLNNHFSCSFDQALDGEVYRHQRCKDTQDHQDAVRAFTEKRKPVFNGI